MKMKSNSLEGKWFIDHNNEPHEIVEFLIRESSQTFDFEIVIRGKNTCWVKVKDSYFVKWIGDKEDVISYAKTLQNRQLVKNLFCNFIVTGTPDIPPDR